MKKYPFTKQHDIKDCGSASLSMIIKYYGGFISLESLKELTGTTKNGVSAYQLIESAKSIGFDSRGIEIEFDNIDKNIHLPSIAFTLIDNTYKHYLVVYEIDYKRKKLIIGDPASKVYKVSFEDFKKIYKNIMIELIPVHKIPKYKKTNLIYKLVLNTLKDKYRDLIIMIFYSVIVTFLSIISSMYFKIVIDSNKDVLVAIFIIFLLIEIVRSIIEFFRNKIFIIINNAIDVVLTYDVFRKIIMLPYSYYRNKTTGEVISRFNDLSKIKEVVSKIMLTLFVDLMLSIISLIFLFNINKTLFLIAIIMMIIYMLVILVFRPFLASKIKDNTQRQSLVSSYLVEAISGFETVKGINLESNIITSFYSKYRELSNSNKSLNNIYNLENFIKNAVYYIGYIFIIFIASNYVNNITTGEIIMFLSLLVYFIEPVKNIISLDSLIRESNISLDRINEIIDYEESDSLINLDNIKNISIKNLNYEVNGKVILDNINLDIKSNEKIMLIGKSGSGKSTLLKMIKNYYPNNQVYLNDVSINNINKSTLNKICYVSQNEILFTDTLYNNIIMNRKVEQDRFINVTKMFHIDEIIKDNMLGYNSLIEENGFNISGGEKQRIVLARTFIVESDVILIDEGLSQIDENLERIIIKNILKNFKNKIIILVTHRTSNMDLFDKVIKMDNKKIEEILVRNKGG